MRTPCIAVVLAATATSAGAQAAAETPAAEWVTAAATAPRVRFLTFDSAAFAGLTNAPQPPPGIGIGFGLGRETGDLPLAMTNENDFVDTMARGAGLAEIKRLSSRGVKVSSVFLSLDQMRETVSTLRAGGVRCAYLAYNPERNRRTPQAELDDFVGSVAKARKLAADYGASLVVGPGMRFMIEREGDYARAAPYADVWLIQSQGFQIDKETGRRATPGEYGRNVRHVADLIRQGNPKTKIWVQIIVCPGARAGNDFTAAEIVALARSIEGVVDAVRIYKAGAVRGIGTLKEVIALLRNAPPAAIQPSPPQ